MSDDEILPRRLTVLGDAMRPLLPKLKQQLDMPVTRTTPVFSMVDVVAMQLDRLETVINRLTEAINGPISESVAKEDTSDAGLYRAAGRFEAVLDDLLSGYREVRRLNPDDAGAEVADLLADIYRHSLVEICDWLSRLVEALADPMAVAEARVLPGSGRVGLDIDLVLTAAPQLKNLADWAQRQSASFAASACTVRNSSGLSFWGIVGAVILGWWIGESMFDDHDRGGGAQ